MRARRRVFATLAIRSVVRGAAARPPSGRTWRNQWQTPSPNSHDDLAPTIEATSRSGRRRARPRPPSLERHRLGARPRRHRRGNRRARRRSRADACPTDAASRRRSPGRDPSTDIAVLRFAGEARPIAPDARVGPAARPSCRRGRASRRRRHRGARDRLARRRPWHSSHGGKIDARLRFDLRLAMTAEGGALVTADGELIGMAVHGPRRRVLAIPAATISRVVATIKDKGHVARGYLGVSLQSVPLPARDGEHHRRAAMVVTIDPAGPAQAGRASAGRHHRRHGRRAGDGRARHLPAPRARQRRPQDGGRTRPRRRADDGSRSPSRHGPTAERCAAIRLPAAPDPRRRSRRGSRVAGADVAGARGGGRLRSRPSLGDADVDRSPTGRRMSPDR